jgi:histidinol-phosphate aminotransferase
MTSLKSLSLHRNEYYFEHSQKVRELLAGPVDAEMVSTYSRRDLLDSFIQQLAKELEVPCERVNLYHGAEDALFKILSWASGRQLTVHTTGLGWAEYMRMMQGLEIEVKQTPIVEQEDQYQHPTVAFEQALAAESARALVLLASPNNPTGHDPTPEEIVRLATRFSHHTFLVDRVYQEFSRETFAALSSRENIITLGSFSKFFGLPGLRVGFSVGNVPSVQSMALGPGPWALQICKAALEDCEYYRGNWKLMADMATRLQEIQTPAGRFMKTKAPFVLFRCDKRIHEEDLRNAQDKAAVTGKIIFNGPEMLIRWSLGSPEAFQRIKNCIQNLESRLSY